MSAICDSRMTLPIMPKAPGSVNAAEPPKSGHPRDSVNVARRPKYRHPRESVAKAGIHFAPRQQPMDSRLCGSLPRQHRGGPPC